jgi:two-component system response regulator PilR (NtrC family)
MTVMESSRLLARMHVLVVDEDVTARARIEGIVTGEGGVASSVTTAERALDFAAVIRPTVVVSDLRLGDGRSGVWLLDRLQAGALASVPVIATSVVADDDALAAALPFSGFVAKPVDVRELCAVLLGVAGPRGLRPAGAR